MTLSFQNRVAALGCLCTVLVSCGGYLDLSTRSLIDSTVLAGLVEMEKHKSVLSSSAPTVGMLEVSLCCITTPWNDGSMTSMYDSIVRVARRCENYADVNVCKSAKSLLMACNTVSVPRAPPLLYVSRAAANQQHQEERAAADLVNDIDKARVAIARAQRADEEMKNKKAEEKSRRQNEEAEETIRKRRKVETLLKQKQNTARPMEPHPSGKVDSKVEDQEMVSEPPSKPVEPEAVVEEEYESDPQQPDPEMNIDESDSSEKEDAQMKEEEGDDFDFPDIVQGGGPDSDDE